jgi:hypothetical protein
MTANTTNILAEPGKQEVLIFGYALETLLTHG